MAWWLRGLWPTADGSVDRSCWHLRAEECYAGAAARRSGGTWAWASWDGEIQRRTWDFDGFSSTGKKLCTVLGRNPALKKNWHQTAHLWHISQLVWGKARDIQPHRHCLQTWRNWTFGGTTGQFPSIFSYKYSVRISILFSFLAPPIWAPGHISKLHLPTYGYGSVAD